MILESVLRDLPQRVGLFLEQQIVFFNQPGNHLVNTIVFAVAETFFTLLTKAVIDDVEFNAGRGLVFWAIAFVGLAIFNGVSVWVFIHLAGNISIGMSCDIRKEAFDRL